MQCQAAQEENQAPDLNSSWNMNSKASPKETECVGRGAEGPRSVAVRGTAGAGCQRLSNATRLQGAWLLGRHGSDPPLLLPNCSWSSHRPSLRPRAGVRHSGAALLFQEVRFPTLPSHGAAPGRSVPRSARTSQETSLLLRRPLPTRHATVLPRANSGRSRPLTACHRGGEGRDSSRGQGAAPTPARRPGYWAPPAGLRSPLPSLTCPSWRRRGYEAGQAAQRGGSGPSEPRRAAETPPRPGGGPGPLGVGGSRSPR